nr:cupin domain-containing protein [Mycobacterium avium]
MANQHDTAGDYGLYRVDIAPAGGVVLVGQVVVLDAGDYGLYRVDIAPAGGGPGPHFHRAMSEAFFVLSGTMKLYDGTEWTDGHQGDFLYVPPGGVHGFRNEADDPASILMLFAPGAPREAYFEGFAALADMTDEERREWFARHDNFWVQ